MGCPQKALRELVGDIVILSQQLTREIKPNGIGTVFLNNPAQSIGHKTNCLVPCRYLAMDHRMQQAALQIERLAQSGAFNAEFAEVRRMLNISFYRSIACTIGRDVNTAANPAIRACRLGGRRKDVLHQGVFTARRILCRLIIGAA